MPEREGNAVGPSSSGLPYTDVLAVSRDGVVPLAPVTPGTWQRRRLHLAVVIPPFRRGSGGHSLIFALVRRLEGMGHTCSIWLHDPGHRGPPIGPAVARRHVREWFSPVRAPFFRGFDAWHGADVAVATGWETAHAVARLDHVKARAYLVSDHEPDFYPASTEALFAAQTYGLGFYPISGSTWLRDLLADRYGARGVAYRFGVDHDIYRRRPVERRRDTVLFYARAGTPRRAVLLGSLALEELVARRPEIRVVTFGEAGGLRSTYSHEELGIATPDQLAWAYCAGTVGLCLSLTNPSLVPQEMMACGLPCVDLAEGPSEAVFGANGPVELAEADPVALANAMERLMDDDERWQRRSELGLEFAASASWDSAAEQVEAGLRAALRQSEEAPGSS